MKVLVYRQNGELCGETRTIALRGIEQALSGLQEHVRHVVVRLKNPAADGCSVHCRVTVALLPGGGVAGWALALTARPGTIAVTTP
jgi:hypothetical protein